VEGSEEEARAFIPAELREATLATGVSVKRPAEMVWVDFIQTMPIADPPVHNVVARVAFHPKMLDKFIEDLSRVRDRASD
jgi:hypothetical protein